MNTHHRKTAYDILENNYKGVFTVQSVSLTLSSNDCGLFRLDYLAVE